MAKIISITNQKGGVGKTTTCVNLAASLVATKRRVLVIDLDPQGNATMGSGVEKNQLDKTIYDVLTQRASIKEVLIQLEVIKFDLVPANGDVTAAEVELINAENKESRLKQALSLVDSDYDYIFIDCPPSLNMLTLNALVASGSVIIPMQCEYYALEGLSALVATLERIQSTLNADLRIEGLLRTMYDPRNALTTAVSRQLIEHFGDKVYRTVIPRNIRLAEAPSHGLPALQYDKNSRGAVSYLALAGEMIRKEENDQGIQK